MVRGSVRTAYQHVTTSCQKCALSERRDSRSATNATVIAHANMADILQCIGRGNGNTQGVSSSVDAVATEVPFWWRRPERECMTQRPLIESRSTRLPVARHAARTASFNSRSRHMHSVTRLHSVVPLRRREE